MSRLYAKGKRLQQVIRMHHFFYNWPFWKDVKHPSWTFVFVSPVFVCVCYCIRYYLQCKCEEKKRAHSSKSDSFCWIVQWEWKMLGKICKWEKRSHTINVEPNAENRWQNHKGKWLVIIWLVRFVVGWQCNCFRLMFRTKCTECSFLWALLLFNMPSKMSRMMLRRRTRKKMRWQFSTYSGIEFPWLCELSSAEKSICSMKSELAKPKEMFSNWKRGRKNEGIENSKEREDTFSLWTLPEVGDNDFAFVISDFRLFFVCVLHPLHLHLSTSLVLFLPFYSLCRPLWHVLHPLYLVYSYFHTQLEWCQCIFVVVINRMCWRVLPNQMV